MLFFVRLWNLSKFICLIRCSIIGPIKAMKQLLANLEYTLANIIYPFGSKELL